MIYGKDFLGVRLLVFIRRYWVLFQGIIPSIGCHIPLINMVAVQKAASCGVVKGYQIVVDVIVLSTYWHVDASLRTCNDSL